jgi:hypothetical protein
MGIQGASVAGCNIYALFLFFLGIVVWAGDLTAWAKGIVNSTKAQVPDQLLGRVLSRGPPPNHQISALPTEGLNWLVRLLKDLLSLYPVRLSTFINHPP